MFYKDRKLRKLAVNVVDFYADRDPKGFIDEIEKGETLDEAKARLVRMTYQNLVDRDYQPAIDMVYSPHIPNSRMRSRMLDIMGAIEDLRWKPANFRNYGKRTHVRE